jgi:hypothetical protein
MAFSTITSEQVDLAVSQISSGSFYETFGTQSISEALRSPLAQQSSKVRRAIKEAYNQNIERTNQTGTTDSYLTSVDDPNNESSGSPAASSSSSSSSLDEFDEELIFVIVNGLLTSRTFLTKVEVGDD